MDSNLFTQLNEGGLIEPIFGKLRLAGQFGMKNSCMSVIKMCLRIGCCCQVSEGRTDGRTKDAFSK